MGQGFGSVYALKGGWREWIGSAYPSEAKDRVDYGCVACHSRETPEIVAQWREGLMSANQVGCPTCHGTGHRGMEDADQAAIPMPERCFLCHEDQARQFRLGKHSKAWKAMQLLPLGHGRPEDLPGALKDCSACHRIGTKSEAEAKALKRQRGAAGVASCSFCHSQHVFSVAAAQRPQECQACHAGFPQGQWEAYRASPHGSSAGKGEPAARCQDCHFAGGDHNTRAAWGYLGLRWDPAPETAIPEAAGKLFQALGILNAAGQPGDFMLTARRLDLFRTRSEDWQAVREGMLAACSACHTRLEAEAALAAADRDLEDLNTLLAPALADGGGLPLDRAPEAAPGNDARYRLLFEARIPAFHARFHLNPAAADARRAELIRGVEALP